MLRSENIVSIDQPEAIMTLYKSGHIDFRNIDDNGEVGASRPLYQETIKKIFLNTSNEHKIKTFKGMLSGNILYMDNINDMYVWYRKPGKQKLNIGEIKSFYLPGLVFKLKENQISVIAVRNIKPDAICYRAPFSNIHGKSKVCMGSAKIKIDTLNHIEDVIEYAEHQFFFSKFASENSLKKTAKGYDWKNIKTYEFNLKEFIYGEYD